MWPGPPPGVELWVYLLCLSLAVVLLGIAKAGFGGAIGIVTVPLMAVALPIDRTIGVMLPILIAADVLAFVQHRKHGSRSHLIWLLTGAAIGIVIATALLYWLSHTAALNRVLNIVIGGLCLAFVVLQLFRLAGGRLPRVPGSAWAARITGGLAGVVSTLTHAAGPIVSIYLLEQRMDKRLLTGTAVTFFFIVNVAKLPTYFSLSLIDTNTLTQSLWCLPLVPIGAVLGIWMHHRIAEKPFTIVVYVGAAAAAARMIYVALAG